MSDRPTFLTPPKSDVQNVANLSPGPSTYCPPHNRFATSIFSDHSAGATGGIGRPNSYSTLAQGLATASKSPLELESRRLSACQRLYLSHASARHGLESRKTSHRTSIIPKSSTQCLCCVECHMWFILEDSKACSSPYAQLVRVLTGS